MILSLVLSQRIRAEVAFDAQIAVQFYLREIVRASFRLVTHHLASVAKSFRTLEAIIADEIALDPKKLFAETTVEAMIKAEN